MPAQWTADIIGKMHLHNISRKQLADKLGLHHKYVIMVLNGKKNPANAEQRFNKAVDEIILTESRQING